MNEKETVVYFYCRKENPDKSTKDRKDTAGMGKEKSIGKFSGIDIWIKMRQKILQWKNGERRENIYKNLCRRINQGEDLINCKKKHCYGILYITCELPFSLDMIQRNDEPERGEKEKNLLTFEEAMDVIGFMKKSLVQKLEMKDANYNIVSFMEKTAEYYVNYEIRLQRKLQLSSEGCPGTFFVNYYKSHIRDGILMVRDGERAEGFLREIYENLNALLIITSNRERWEHFAQEAYDQSGLIFQYDSEINRRRKIWEEHYLFDFAHTTDEKTMQIRALPKRIRYVDCMPCYEKERVIQGKRKDITYIPCPKCLDTC